MNHAKKTGHLAGLPALDLPLSTGTVDTAIAAPVISHPLTLAPDSWKSAVNGNWATAADWSAGVPTSSNDVTVSVAGTYTVTVAAAAASNSVTLNNATARINDTSTLAVATNIAVTAGQFIVNNTGVLQGGTVSVGASGKFLVYSGATLSGITYQGTLTPSVSATVYIQNGITLTGAGGTGNGTISMASGSALNILDSETLNNATLTFGAGTTEYLYLNEASSTSTQSLTLGSGFTITQSAGNNIIGPYEYDSGSITDAGLISVSGGTLVVGNGLGTFSDSGSIAVSGGVFDLATTMVASGTISTSGTGTFLLDSTGVLTGTVSAASVALDSNTGTLDALTWKGPLSLLAGQTAYIAGGLSVTGTGGTGNGTISLSAGSDSLYVLDNETLNNETLNFGNGNGDYFGLYEPSTTTIQTLTLGSGFIVTQSGGTNYLDGFYYETNGLLINQGTIAVSGGDLVEDANLSGFTNSGKITVSGGTFTADNGGIFTNAGSITISGGIFDLQTTMTATGSIATSGSGVFEIDSSAVLSGIIAAASSDFSFQGGTLSAASWQGPLTLGASQTVLVENGLSVTGAGGSGQGTISLAAGGDLFVVLDTETLNNETLTFGSSSNNSTFYVAGTSSTQTVTLGTGFTMTQGGGSNYVSGYDYNYYGNLANAGLINVSGGTLGVDYLTVFSNSGNIAVSAGTITTSAISTFTNTGSITLSNAGSLNLSGVGKFGSFSGGTLSGNYNIGAASVLELANNDSISTLAGSVTLTGAGSLLESTNTNNNAQITLDSQLTTVAATGSLTLGAGRNFTGAKAFVDNGSVGLGGGTLTETSFTLGSTGTLSGSGKITPAVTDGGHIIASGGTLTIAGAITGTGGIAISAGATFEAGAATAAQETVTFNGLASKVKIDAPASFASVLSGFAAGDVIDFAKTTLTGISASGTSLLAVSASGTTTLTLAAALTGDNLALSSDGAGGTNVTAYALAQSSLHAPEPVAFGNHHVGDSVSTALTLINTAPANGYAEALDASLGTATGAATASGSFTGLAAGQSNSSSLLVGLNTAAAGTLTGTAIITLNSDGTGIDGFGTTSLGTQSVNVTGAVYAYAQAGLANGGTVTLANTHIGQAAAGTLAVSNTAAANGYAEALDATLGSAGAGFSASGSFAGLAAGGTNSALTLGYSGGADGFYTGTATLSLLSDGTGIDGLGITALAPQTVTITGAAYAYATAQLSTAITLGIVHVGQADSTALTLSNSAAANGYSEALDAAWGSATGITTSGSLTGLAPGLTDMSSLSVGLATSSSGSFSGTALLGLVSDGTGIDGLGTTTLTGKTITVAGIVDNYALAAFADPGGPAIAGSGTSYAITLASVAQGSAAEILSLGALNAATGLADLLQGTLSTAGGTGFTNTGFGSFSGLGAGQSEHSQSVTLSTSSAGTFSETILLSSAGTNASGYNGALATETLTVTGVVTPIGSTTYTLAAGPNHIVGAAGGDVFIAPTYSLNSRDSLTGGTGANVMQLSGGGQFDLGAPSVFANIPTITAYEGQLASGTLANTRQVVFLRDGSNENLSVVAGVAAKGNSNPESIVIYSSNATNTINLSSGADSVFLATGTDTVVLGGTKNSVVAGGGTALVQASAALATASVVGTTTGSTTLEVTTAGTFVMNAADTYLTVKLDAATRMNTDKLSFITVNAANGGDTIVAYGTNQTLIGGAGDVLYGDTAGTTTFLGASTALNGDSLGNWTVGDVIDLTNINSVTLQPLTYANGKLTVSDGTHSSTFTVAGTGLALHNFVAVGSDGNGGTLIDYHT